MIRLLTMLSLVVSLWPTSSPAEAQAARTLRVYFIGNSVTDTIRYDSLADLAASRGHTLVWGRQMISGAPLQWLWDHPDDGFKVDKFGYPREALAQHEWDHQIHKDGIHLNETGSYIVACTYFATLFGESPVGLPTEPYGKIDPAVAKVIQETVWKVVREHSESGVK